MFDPFRLVGGTSLSLQLGHRKSEDIDLFTSAFYDLIDFTFIDKYIRKIFPYVSDTIPGPIGWGTVYFIGESKEETVKLDMYYTDEFIRPAVKSEEIRMAGIEEIIAMKLDVVQRSGRKKDFTNSSIFIRSKIC